MDKPMPSLISYRALGVGLIASILIYVGFVAFVLLKGPQALEDVEMSMASQVLPLEFPETIGEAKSLPVAQTDHLEEDLQQSNSVIETSDTPALSKQALPPAPYEGLTEHTDFGPLPVIGPNKLAPFDAYKKPYVLNRDKPAIALMVRGYGMSDALSRQALTVLPSNISLLISPYSDVADDLRREARQNGHEVWLELPLENERFPANDPGPHAILSHLSLKYNLDNYKWVLGRTTGYAGLAGYSDGVLSRTRSVFENVMQDAYGRGLGYYEINPRGGDLAEASALSYNAPYASNILPATAAERQALEKDFQDLKQQARSNGYASGVLNLTPYLLDNIQEIVRIAESEGFYIVPVSAIADR